MTDDVNQGTFNFASPDDNPVGHALLDVVPYILLGNTPNDPTNPIERATAGYEGDVDEERD